MKKHRLIFKCTKCKHNQNSYLFYGFVWWHGDCFSNKHVKKLLLPTKNLHYTRTSWDLPKITVRPKQSFCEAWQQRSINVVFGNHRSEQSHSCHILNSSSKQHLTVLVLVGNFQIEKITARYELCVLQRKNHRTPTAIVT